MTCSASGLLREFDKYVEVDGEPASGFLQNIVTTFGKESRKRFTELCGNS